MVEIHASSTCDRISEEEVTQQFDALESELADMLERFHTGVLVAGLLDLLLFIVSRSEDPQALADRFAEVLRDVTAREFAAEERRVM